MYAGMYINKNKCNPVVPDRLSLVDIESELKDIMRPRSSCPEKKYTPGCKFTAGKPNTCLSTFDPRANVCVPASVCPEVERHLIFNSGLRRPTGPGYKLPKALPCAGR
jgi:hypothetical protein